MSPTTDLSADPFTPELFFARAAERLAKEPPARDALAGFGDHRLNPDLVPVAGMKFRDAAVLIGVVARRPEASVILTQRTAHLPSHAGQVAFPGGKVEADDADAAAAAIREAQEEVGLDPALVETIGYLDPYLTTTGYRIVPVLAKVSPELALTPNPDEVAAVFEVPLAFLMTPQNHRRGSRDWKGRTRFFYEMPFGERYIWGVTAGIIRGLYERVFD